MPKKQAQAASTVQAAIPPFKCFPYPDDPAICVRYDYDPDTGKYDLNRKRIPCSQCPNRFTGDELVEMLASRTQDVTNIEASELAPQLESGDGALKHTLDQDQVLGTLKDLLDRLLDRSEEETRDGTKAFLYPNGINSIEITIGFAPSPTLQLKVSGP